MLNKYMVRIYIQPKYGSYEDRLNWCNEYLQYFRHVVSSILYPEGEPYSEMWEFRNNEDAMWFKMVWG